MLVVDVLENVLNLLVVPSFKPEVALWPENTEIDIDLPLAGHNLFINPVLLRVDLPEESGDRACRTAKG